MKSFEFSGWVHSIDRQSWGVEVEVRAEADETGVKFPQHILLTASKKKSDLVPDDLDVNDRVTVTFIPILNKGVSQKTKRVFAINKMMIAKFEVDEKVRGGSSEPSPSEDDVPF